MEGVKPGQLTSGRSTTLAQYQKVQEYYRIARRRACAPPSVGGALPRRTRSSRGATSSQPTVYTGVRERHAHRARGGLRAGGHQSSPSTTRTRPCAIANDSDYGLAAGLWTRDVSRAHRVAARLEAGQVYVNDWIAGGIETPFGGYKQSGYGREKGIEALHHYTQLKCVTIKL